ncbi:MAG: RNA methyltransferase [Gammaproteobacteria bacterium]
MKFADIHDQLAAAGARPVHAQRLLRAWVCGRAMDEPGSTPELPVRLKAVLPAIASRLSALADVRSEHPAADGSARLLVRLADGQTVESVLLPPTGVCVSTQVGCAVGCVFCMTGRDGLQRQLGSVEIVAQTVLARHRQPVRKVVFMGMGEPAHNLDNVLEAIGVLGTFGGIGHKNLVFSTVGDRRVFERLPAGPVKPALALSLHTSNAELRARLLPNAPRIEPRELIELGECYARATTYPIQYQWTLIDGVNDSDAELEAIVSLLKGKYAVMNFIPYNTVDGLDFKRPSAERATAMVAYLIRHGILAKLRRSAGQDVEGGCGQLRARAVSVGTAGIRDRQIA